TLAVSPSSSNSAPLRDKVPSGPKPEQAAQRDGATAQLVPSQLPGRPQPAAESKGAKADEPTRDVPAVPAAGETLLSQAFFDRWYAYLEWLLEIRLTESQRRESPQLSAQHWKRTDQAKKDRFWASANAEFKWWAEAAKQSEAEAAEMRAERRLPLLARLQRSAERDERLLLSLYESGHAPGTERNPVLVPGTPALTQEMVDQGRRWNQWVLDVRLTAP